MKDSKKIFWTFLIIAIGLTGYFLLTQQPFSFIRLSNSLFMVSLFFLIIGFTILIMSSGFFDNFQRSMKHLLHLRKKQEPKDFIPISKIIQTQPVYWLSIGGILLLLSVLLLFVTSGS